MKHLLAFLFLLITKSAFSQTDSTRHLVISGFADIYYSYDFNNPPSHQRPDFLYNHKRHNEFNVNLALVKLAYTSDRVRGNLALMAGTYAQYNLAAEQELLKNLYEANAGIKISKGLWIDAGIFPSHLGLESAVSKDNYTLTRSLAAENSPYYESGIKITYETGSRWVFTGLVLNGWQNIREPEGNSNKAIGTQVQFRPSSKILINSSTFIGNEKPDHVKQRRYFHDFYAIVQVLPQLKVAGLFDIGFEERLDTDKYYSWFSPALLVQYSLMNKLSMAARTEYYHDKNNVIIDREAYKDFRTFGYSLNLDYAPTEKMLLRIEGRLFNSKQAIFTRGTSLAEHSTAITSSMAVTF